jgi:hypothetical protein
MFNDSLAWFFRSVNTRLLYSTSWLEEKVVKLVFLLSIRFYKAWMREKHASSALVLRNIDRNLSMKVDLSKSMGAAFYWMGFHELNEWNNRTYSITTNGERCEQNALTTLAISS